MNDSFIEQIRRRTFRSYYQDGLVEMTVGLLFALIGLALWAYDRALSDTSYAWALGLGIFLLVAVGVWGVKAAVMRLKERVVYPRAGKVTFNEQPSRGRWLLMAAIAIFTLLSFYFPDWARQMPVMVGVLMAMILAFMGTRVSLRRLQLAAVLPLAVGILAGYFGIGEILGVAAVFGASGLALLIGGLVVLGIFLRDNPPNESGEAM